MSKPLIAVTGRNGQLGRELEQLSENYAGTFNFLFTARAELDLGNTSTIPAFFEKHKPAYFINCAAYTAVDKAETEQETAFMINAESVGIIAQQCRVHGCTLITISTDYVFDGKGTKPYQTNHATDPVNYYGYSKWLGEKLALENNERTIIIRTSWLYSPYGNNFVKTMLRLMKEREELSVVNDQTGSPTYAADLADAILRMVVSLEEGNTHYGIYHLSNEGVISWYDFAIAIRDASGLTCKILPVPSSQYPTAAKRPSYSVLSKTGIVADFTIQLKDWYPALVACLSQLK
jgi:dTDP-4-dehydrorhamnose reductase